MASTPAVAPQRKAATTTPPVGLVARGDVVAERWLIVDKLGSGGFSEIYRAVDQPTRRDVAIKLQPIERNNHYARVRLPFRWERDGACLQMVLEQKVLMLMRDKSEHVPKVWASGEWGRLSYIVLPVLSRNLSDLRRESPTGHLSCSTALRLTRQALGALHDLHENNYLHRDVKPSNMAVGASPADSRTVFLFDFGMARRFRTADGQIRPERAHAGFRGTLRYVSLRVHERADQCRADDLWGLYYTMVELARGHLPWRNQQDEERVRRSKIAADHERLCERLSCAAAKMPRHLATLDYEARPDYEQLDECLRAALAAVGGHDDDVWDWTNDYRDIRRRQRRLARTF